MQQELIVPKNPWLRTGFDAWWLGFEASSVIALRTMKMISGGDAALVEARQMVSEKIEAGLALQTMALTGALGITAHGAAAKTLVHYRRKVRANRRRLAKK
jgi:hypothetical protein